LTVTFANPLPWWGLVACGLACVLLAYAAYSRTGPTLLPWRRALLVALRAVVLGSLVVCLLRPVATMPSRPGDEGVVALVVDTSRSMRIPDAGGSTRIDAAAGAARRVAADIGGEFRVDVFAAGERLERATLDRLPPDGRRSDLAGAIAAVRERYKDRPLAGIVLLSDGAETGRAPDAGAREEAQAPVFTVGVGAGTVGRDREVRSVAAGPSALDASLVDLTATVVAHGERRIPVRLLQGTRALDVREVDAPADGSPVPVTFTVLQDRLAPAVFRIETPPVSGELTEANNAADVLVAAPGRPRRVLMVEGQPGYEHSFLKRAWHEDPSFSLDSVVRKGRNDLGQETFYVQAAPGRTSALTTGFPESREALFAYDAVVLANLEPDALPREQQALLADFVGERGGGLLVLGSRALARPLSAGSPLASALPLDLVDRRAVARAAASSGERLKVSVTDEGVRHPVMRLDATGADLRRRWAALPALAGAANTGGPRPGASVLAVTTAPAGGVVPLVTVQRFGAGRSMIFGGEASWHWKMMVPVSDKAYDAFWRQSLRWLAGEAPEAVSIAAPSVVPPGAQVPIDVAARDASFGPVARPAVTLSLRSPDGVRDLAAAAAGPGHATATWQADAPGLYELAADVRDGERPIGTATRTVLVGGVDPEFTDPRLNEDALRRLASGGGGEYVAAADVARIGASLRNARASSARREVRDLWHNGWALAFIAGVLSCEWALRRRWGLR
jgi:uncharacterized membrane protein